MNSISKTLFESYETSYFDQSFEKLDCCAGTIQNKQFENCNFKHCNFDNANLLRHFEIQINGLPTTDENF